MEFARSKSEARKEGLTGIGFKDVAALDPILGEVLEVVEVGHPHHRLRLDLMNSMAAPRPPGHPHRQQGPRQCPAVFERCANCEGLFERERQKLRGPLCQKC